MAAGSVQNIVETTFTVGDHASSQFSQIGGAAQQAGQHLSGLNSLVGIAKAAFAGWLTGEAIHKVTELGDKFEQNQIKIGGMLAALGQAGDINEGLKMADQTIQAINVAAAKLPGEAEEYVDVFRGVFPQVQRSIGGSLEQMYGFTNKLTAIGKAFGLDSGIIARETAMMLQVGHGRAGSHIVLWQSLLPYIQKAAGNMTLTAEEFNKMSEQARGKLIENAFKGLQPMLDKSAESFDAMKGAAVSSIKMIARLGTQPLFEGIKSGLGEFNALLMDDKGALTTFGKHIADVGASISTHIVDAFVAASDVVSTITQKLDQLGDSPAMMSLKNIGIQLGDLTGDVGSSISKHFANSVDVHGAEKYSASESSDQVVTSLASMLESLTGAVVPTTDAIISMGAAALGFVQQAAPGVAQASDEVTGPLVDIWDNLMAGVSSTFEHLKAPFESLGSHFGNMAKSLGDMLVPILNLTAKAVQYMMEGVNEFVDKCIWPLMDSVHELIDEFSKLFSAIGSLIGMIPGAQSGPRGNASILDAGETKGFMDWMKDQNAGGVLAHQLQGSIQSLKKAVSPHTPGARGGGQTTQDFRFSKFYLDQKFAEGYDPDRIATTIIAGIGKTGEHRLQSGHEPGGIR